jgi:tRNASer (uridine44-2'-O)-methyltransferase
MKVFLLPCCPFDFNGAKYQRISSNISQYNCFINYMISVCETLGFNTKSDKLRIPSTKRICIICDSRSYDSNSENDMKVKRKQFINSKISNFTDYKPREKVEAVRNCTRVPKDVLNKIVNVIANELLKDNEKLMISDVANFLNNDMLSHLKSQCGGLQTLLRNHKHIFEGIFQISIFFSYFNIFFHTF